MTFRATGTIMGGMRHMKTKKPRMGRPPKGLDAKTTTLAVKVSARELAAWTKAAGAAGMPLRAYVLKPRRDELERGR